MEAWALPFRIPGSNVVQVLGVIVSDLHLLFKCFSSWKSHSSFFGLFFLGYHYYMVYCMDHLWKMLYSLLCSSSWVNLLFYLFVYLLTYFRVRSCCMARTVLELTMVLRLALNLFVVLLLLPPCAVIIGLCHYHYPDNCLLFFLLSYQTWILGPCTY